MSRSKRWEQPAPADIPNRRKSHIDGVEVTTTTGRRSERVGVLALKMFWCCQAGALRATTTEDPRAVESGSIRTALDVVDADSADGLFGVGFGGHRPARCSRSSVNGLRELPQVAFADQRVERAGHGSCPHSTGRSRRETWRGRPSAPLPSRGRRCGGTEHHPQVDRQDHDQREHDRAARSIVKPARAGRSSRFGELPITVHANLPVSIFGAVERRALERRVDVEDVLSAPPRGVGLVLVRPQTPLG